MPIMCIFRVQRATPADYDEVRRRVRWEDSPPPGGIAHFLTFTADGGAVEYNVWESRAAFETFHKTRMLPVLDALGIDMGRPELVDLDGIAIAEAVTAYQLPRAAAAVKVLETDALA